jgi:hypothetical protein
MSFGNFRVLLGRGSNNNKNGDFAEYVILGPKAALLPITLRIQVVPHPCKTE